MTTTAVRPTQTRPATITAQLLDCVGDAILVVDTDMTVTYANRVAVELATDATAGAAAPLLDPVALVHPADLPEALRALEAAAECGRSQVRLRLVLPSGERPVEVTLTDHLSTPGIDGIVACFRNLEHEAELERSLERERQLDDHIQVALTDQLTGLPMRRLLLDRLGEALERARPTGAAVSIFFIDLDGFKAINDALGHSAGDAMLRSTTNRLLSAHEHLHHWGRIGGDEFVLFRSPCEVDEALQVAEELSTALRQSVMLGGRSFYTSASIGVAVVDEGGTDAEGAVRRADIAMYEGKRRGHSSVTLFTPEMEERVVVRAELENQFRSTLTGAGPDVVFQPIVDLRSGQTVAVEALARWHSRTHGPIGPERFVPMAERMSVIDQLDRHMLRKAARTIGPMRDPGTGLALDLTVNSSTMSLSRCDAADRILDVLADESFPPERLILEVTESIAVEDDARLREQLTLLRQRGVRIAVDDFGTGHSSLAQLEILPVDIVKLDRSFLADVPGSSRRVRYVETIIAMASALDLHVVFEGVEHPEQARSLAAIGVTLAQGYLLAEPTSGDDLLESMAAARTVVHETVRADEHIQALLDWSPASS